MPIVPSSFARECVEDGWEFGVQPHYMIAVARMRSHIVDDTDGDRVGPFRLNTTEWEAARTDPESDIDFLPTDITVWRKQCAVFALMSSRSQEAATTTLGRNPSVLELYLQQWPTEKSSTLLADLQQALYDTVALLTTAISEVMDSNSAEAAPIKDANKPPATSPPAAKSSEIDLSSISKTRREMAIMIIDAFAVEYGKWQQIAALANAIAESTLNPNAKAGGSENSWGLFQLNITNGLGRGKTPAQLKDPATNIAIILAETKKFPAFGSAGSLEQAVAIFVKKIEKPLDTAGAVVSRIKIAQQFLA